MAAPTKTYRDSVSGAVGVYPVTLASRFPRLVEVDEGAKPLAFTPIPQDAVDALTPSEAPEAAPKPARKAK